MNSRPVEQGHPINISAREWNGMRDMLRDWNSRHSVRGGRQRFATDSIRVSIRNDTGSDLGRFSILKITGVVFDNTDNEDEFKNRWVLKGDAPSDSADVVCVIQSAVKDGKVVHGVVAGVTPCLIDVTDASHKFANVNDEDEFESAVDGAFPILYKDSGTGSKDAMIILGGASAGGAFFKTPTGGITAATEVNSTTFLPGSGVCTKVGYNGTNIVVGSGTRTIYNSTPSAVKGDAIIQAKVIDGEYFVDVEPCADFE